MRPGCFFMLSLFASAVFLATVPAEDTAPKTKTSATSQESAREQLSVFNELIGRWRGVAQPKRGSSRGAWFEKSEWQWDFSDKTPRLVGAIEKGKLVKQIAVSAVTKSEPKKNATDAKPAFLVSVVNTDEKTQTFSGTFESDKNRLVAESKPADGYVHRITITLLNRKRTIVLLERRKENASFWSRTAGIGYTREGTSLAVSGSSERECIVTGGRGTMKVSHEGKTYYVCCRGCKVAFEDDPQGTIDAWQKRVAARKAKLAK